MFRTAFGLRLRSVGEHPRAAESVGLSVYRIRYTGVHHLRRARRRSAGRSSRSASIHSFSENMTTGVGFIALAALIFGNWKPQGIFAAALLFGFASAIAQRLPVYSDSLAVLFQALPYLLTLIAVAGIIQPPAAAGRGRHPVRAELGLPREPPQGGARPDEVDHPGTEEHPRVDQAAGVGERDVEDVRGRDVDRDLRAQGADVDHDVAGQALVGPGVEDQAQERRPLPEALEGQVDAAA